MLSLPTDQNLREKFDVADLADRRWITLKEARYSAKRTNWSGIKSVFYLVLRANGEVQLMRFGPRGGRQTLWNFGQA